jgi:hypothetical protein
MSAKCQKRTLRPLDQDQAQGAATKGHGLHFFDARFTAAWTGATNVLGPLVILSTECSYAGGGAQQLVTS